MTHRVVGPPSNQPALFVHDLNLAATLGYTPPLPPPSHPTRQ